MWNRHRESKTRETHEIVSGTKLFITFELKVIQHEERERDTIFLCWLLLHRQLSTQPTRDARSAQTHLASLRSESQPSRSDAGTQLTDFSQIPNSSAHAFGAWRHSLSGIFILTSLNDTSSPHAREHLR